MAEVSRLDQELGNVAASCTAGADIKGNNVVASVEDRAAPRFTLYIRAAKLICDQREFVCVIRDVSATGVSLRSFHPIPQRPDMVLQLQSEDVYPVQMMWHRENEAGFRFKDEVDPMAFIAEDGTRRKRPLRFDLELPVKICVLGKDLEARIINLSQQGAALECDTRLAIDQPLRIKSGLFPEVAAKIRWRRDDVYGAVLENTFRLQDFALLMQRLHMNVCADIGDTRTESHRLLIRN